jgi:hypothetical protein
MATARQYQVRAKVCLELAKEAKDIYARDAMLELAEEFKKAAEKLERHHSVRAGSLERSFEGYDSYKSRRRP